MMATRRFANLVGLLLLAAASTALAGATNPTIYTNASDCNKLPSLKGATNCKQCLPNTSGNVWIVGQGCGKHPSWVNGTAVKAAGDCQWVSGSTGSTTNASTCDSCVSTSQYIVGAGCCTSLNEQRILTQGCVLNTPNLCKKITSATAVSNCLSCLQSGKTFTLGSGCSQ